MNGEPAQCGEAQQSGVATQALPHFSQYPSQPPSHVPLFSNIAAISSEGADPTAAHFAGVETNLTFAHSIQPQQFQDSLSPHSTQAGFNVFSPHLRYDEDTKPVDLGSPIEPASAPSYYNPPVPIRTRQVLQWTDSDLPAEAPRTYRRASHPKSDPAMSASQEDMPILSAQQYDAGPALLRTARSPVMRRAIPPRTKQKRAMTEDAGDEGVEGTEANAERKKRSRGRPRKETTDTNPTEHRRTQIRNAQRAYRERKESAITDLEGKVKDLQKTNDDMGKEFGKIYELAMAQGVSNIAPELTNSLKAMTDKLMSMAQRPGVDGSGQGSESRSPESGEYDGAEDAGPRHTHHSTGFAHPGSDVRFQAPPTFNADEGGPSSSAEPFPFGLVQSSESLPFEFITQPTSGNASFQTHLPYEVITQPTPANSTFQKAMPYEVITQPTSENATFPMYMPMTNESFGNFFQRHAQPSPISGLKSPISYAYQEPTFGKRLQRTAAEAGLRLVSMPTPPPERFAAVFGFSLLFESRSEIVQRLSTGLMRSMHESLNMWGVPFTNLGGAGLYFEEHSSGGRDIGDALRDEPPFGNHGMREVGKPQDVNGFSMGPFSANVEGKRDLVDGKLRMKYLGFEGDFYDSEEVEIYLRKRGIVIPAMSDFVEVEIDTRQLNGDRQDAQSQPGDASPAENMVPGVGHQDTGAGGSAWSSSRQGFDAALPMFTPAGAQLDNPPVQFLCPAIPQRSATHSPPKKIKATLDVQTLIFEIVGKSVCVGRTSAVRPKDIDRAVKLASGLEFGPLYQPVAYSQDKGYTG